MCCWIFHPLSPRNSEEYSNSVVLQNGTGWMPSPLQLEFHSWIFQAMFLHSFFHLSSWASSIIPLLPWCYSSSFFHHSTSSASSMIPLLQLLPWSHFFNFFDDPTSSASSTTPLLQLLPWYPAWASFMIPFLQLLPWSHFFSFLHLSSSVAFLSQGQVLLQRLNCNGDCGQNQKGVPWSLGDEFLDLFLHCKSLLSFAVLQPHRIHTELAVCAWVG